MPTVLACAGCRQMILVRADLNSSTRYCRRCRAHAVVSLFPPTVRPRPEAPASRGFSPWLGGGAVLVVLLVALLPGWRQAAPAARLPVGLFYQHFEHDRTADDQPYFRQTVELHDLPRTVSTYHDRDCLVWYGREARTDRARSTGQGPDRLPAVLLYLRPGERERLAALPPGAPVAVRGRCLGARPAPLGMPDYVVVLDSCVVVMGR